MADTAELADARPGSGRVVDALLEEPAPIEGFGTTSPADGSFTPGNISELGTAAPELCRRLLVQTGVALTPMVAGGALVAEFVRGLAR